MPYSSYWEQQGVLFVFSGIVTDQDLLEANLDIYDDPRFMDLRYEVANFLDVTEFNVTSDMIRKVADLDYAASKRNPNIAVAIVDTSAVIKGLANMWAYSGGAEVWESELFEDEVLAREWLGER